MSMSAILLDKPDNVLFQEFQEKFNIKFTNPAEKTQRFTIFSQNLAEIRALNAAQNNGAQFGINSFSAMTPEEFKQRLLPEKFIIPSDFTNVTDDDVHSPGHWWQHEHRRVKRDTYSENFDWRLQNVVSLIQDQGKCGSCWAFSNVAAVESHYAIYHNGTMPGLSEQELVDCDEGSLGCDGGFTYGSLQYIKDNGLHSRNAYPYTGYSGACQSNMNGEKIKIENLLVLPKNETEIKYYVFNKGPVIINFICPKAFQHYVSGIFSLTVQECVNTNIGGHAVVIIGYGVENGKNFWIAKNSWGTGWGENGFVRFERDIQFCGMARMYHTFSPTYDIVSTTTTTTTTTVTTTTQPVTTTTTTTVPKPTTTLKPLPFTPLNCSGAMDLVFLIDASDTMTAQRFEIVKSQLLIAIDQNGIKWDNNDNNTARVGIVLSTGLAPDEPNTPYRYLDLKGCREYNSLGNCQPTIFNTQNLKQAIQDIPFYGGKNDMGLSMTIPLKGDYRGFANMYYIFGDPLFGASGDRPNVPDAMIVISGIDTNNCLTPWNCSGNATRAASQYKLKGVQLFSIGFQDLPISDLQAMSGNPATAFSTTPENLGNIIKHICSGI
uniref:VWFA domain-containing protein n=1 Tax=Panagrolaimus sp. PS1159 TaxID=55785 RepID=A0AC35FWN2_9BILA